MVLGSTGKQLTRDNKEGGIWYLFDDKWRRADPNEDPEVFDRLFELYSVYKKNKEDTTLWNPLLQSCLEFLKARGEIEIQMKDNLRFLLENLVNFFSEFDFVPNFRFTNTFVRSCSKGCGSEYVINYFKIQDSVCTEDVKAKIESPEFKELVENFASVSSSKRINRRFKIYYGPQGTGKTTTALEETKECVVCHSAMLPSDLMEDFKFVEGKATFSPSPLWKAMENGQKIVLDEINLLPFESLRFLQSLLDGKESFLYKSQEVKIKEGFEIIGTMNLVVNGMKYPLPEPLVDRCEVIKEFTMTPVMLLEAI